MPFNTTFTARTDSGTANNPALNLTGADAIEFTLVAQTGTGDPGDFLLDGGGVPDPDTLVQIGGETFSFTFELQGTLPTAPRDGAGQVPQDFQGDLIYVITVFDYPSPGTNTRLAFLPDSGASLAEMDSFGNGRISVNGDTSTPPTDPLCFLSGTRLATPTGLRPVEDLRPGDLVLSADRGAVPILWVGASRFVWDAVPHKHKPFEVSPGAFGPGRPARSFAVSRQHRMLIPDPVAGSAVLTPVHALSHFPGIRQMRGKRHAAYHHILTPRHEIVFAEGLETETFWPGPQALAALPRAEHAGLLSALRKADLTPETYGPPARPFATTSSLSDLGTPGLPSLGWPERFSAHAQPAI